MPSLGRVSALHSVYMETSTSRCTHWLVIGSYLEASQILKLVRLADVGHNIPVGKAKRGLQQESGLKGASFSQPSLLKDLAAAPGAVLPRPGQDSSSGGSRVPEALNKHAAAPGSEREFAGAQSSSAGAGAGSTHAKCKAAGGSQAGQSQPEQHHNLSALPAGSEEAHQAGTKTTHLLSAAAGMEQVMEQIEGTPSLEEEGPPRGSPRQAMPGVPLDTGKHAVSKLAALSLSTAQLGQHLMMAPSVAEPCSLSDHAASETSGDSVGHREHVDAMWPGDTAQDSRAAAKATTARCDELRSSGGSVGSFRTGSNLSNSQHDSYQGSYPSRPESSGTQGTLNPLNR